MALALAPGAALSALRGVCRRRGAIWSWPNRRIRIASTLLGRALEWKQLADAAELKDMVTRLMGEYRSSRQFLLRAAQHLLKDAYGEHGTTADPQAQNVRGASTAA